jgi:hypothetical protein
MDGLNVLVLDRLALGLNVQHASVDFTPVEHVDRFQRIVLGREQNRTEPARLAIGTRGNIRANNDARRPEEILEVLPLGG